MQKNEREQIGAVVASVEKIIAVMKQRELYTQAGGMDIIEDVRESVSQINQMLYHTTRLRFLHSYDVSERDQYLAWVGELEALLELWRQSLEHRVGDYLDVEFWETYDYFKYADIDEVYAQVVRHFLSLPEGLRLEFLALPHRYTFLRNRLDFTKQDYSLLQEHIELLANHVEDYRWLYGRLADKRSKLVLNRIVQYWLQMDVGRLHSALETAFPDYFDLDILSCGSDDVVVDCGAYTGDTVVDYIRTYGDCKRIYAYEVAPRTYGQMVQNLSCYGNIVPRQKGVGKEAGILYINDGHGAGTSVLAQGEIPVEVVALDEDIAEPITVLKMDIEGSEQDAIQGASAHIKADRPGLLISAYHKPEDLFEIPRLIDSMRTDYQYYLRFHGKGCLWPCDYVLYAV